MGRLLTGLVEASAQLVAARTDARAAATLWRYQYWPAFRAAVKAFVPANPVNAQTVGAVEAALGRLLSDGEAEVRAIVGPTTTVVDGIPVDEVEHSLTALRSQWKMDAWPLLSAIGMFRGGTAPEGTGSEVVCRSLDGYEWVGGRCQSVAVGQRDRAFGAWLDASRPLFQQMAQLAFHAPDYTGTPDASILNPIRDTLIRLAHTHLDRFPTGPKSLEVALADIQAQVDGAMRAYGSATRSSDLLRASGGSSFRWGPVIAILGGLAAFAVWRRRK